MVPMLPRTPPTHLGRPASRFTRALEAGRYLIDLGTRFGKPDLVGRMTSIPEIMPFVRSSDEHD